MCQVLKVPYFGYAIFHLWRVGKQSYTAYSCHGSSGAKLPYTKVKAVIDLTRHISAQMIIMGHVHEVYSQKFAYYEVDKHKKVKVQKDKYAILSGHFLEYEDSYAEEKNMSPSKTGAVKIILESEKNDIHTSQ